MKRFFIITNQQKDRELETTGRITDFLQKNGGAYEVCVRDTLEKITVPGDVECILVLGGDGTLLQAAFDTLDADIPLMGINLGTLGFLAEVEKSNVEQALQALLQDRYYVEERMMIDGEIVSGESSKEKISALNDIVLTRSGSLRVNTYAIYVNGLFLCSYQADGMIVSTPTGSTGYNISAGGPIVEPMAQLLLLTPICSHALSARSIVLSAEDIIEVRIHNDKGGAAQEIEVDFDGSRAHKLCTGDSIRICRSKRVTRLVRLNRENFLEVLHKKISE